MQSSNITFWNAKLSNTAEENQTKNCVVTSEQEQKKH